MKKKPDIVKILKKEESSGKLKVIKDEKKKSNHLITNFLKNGNKVINDSNESNLDKNYSINFQETLKILINLISDPVVIVDKHGKFLEISDRVEELTGEKRENLLGKNFMKTNFLTTKSKAILIKNFTKRMIGEYVGKYDIEAISKNKEIIYLEVNGIKIDYNGKPADLVIFHDISVQKKTEEALKTSEEKWRLLIKNIPDIIVTITPEGKIMSINHTIPGITVEETIGTSVYNFISPEHRDLLRESLKKIIKTGELVTYQTLGTGPKGPNAAWYETIVVPAEYDKQNNSIILISRDITERKEAEQKINEKIQELEKFQNITIDRELKMIDLKIEVNKLCEKYGEEKRYTLEEDKLNGEIKI